MMVKFASRDEMVDCAESYLKLRDDTPITEEFAAKVRSELVEVDDVPLDSSYHEVAGTWLVIINRVPDVCMGATGFVTTCGQVRCLLLAAGIECDV